MPSPYAPAAATAPSLGYGQRGEAPIDQVNVWMRGQPWYQQLIRSFGQDPSNVHLSDSQKQQVIRAAQANGVVVDEGHNGQEVDNSGNFQAKSHALRNTLIVAGIAGAALLTAGAAGAFAPGAAATVGGVESGAYGVGAGTVSALGTGAMASVPVTAGATAAISTAATTVGATAAKAAAAKVAASGGAMTVENILKYALPLAGNVVGNLIEANAAGSARDAQQKYLDQALAYEKEKDAGNVSREASRYADYSGHIAPYLATGNSANARMASLLGLPANAPLTASAPASAGPGSVPTQTGGTPAAATITPQPQARTTAAPTGSPSLVTMQAPDGSQKQVPSDQVDHYTKLGATLIGAAA